MNSFPNNIHKNIWYVLKYVAFKTHKTQSYLFLKFSPPLNRYRSSKKGCVYYCLILSHVILIPSFSFSLLSGYCPSYSHTCFKYQSYVHFMCPEGCLFAIVSIDDFYLYSYRQARCVTRSLGSKLLKGHNFLQIPILKTHLKIPLLKNPLTRFYVHIVFF